MVISASNALFLSHGVIVFWLLRENQSIALSSAIIRKSRFLPKTTIHIFKNRFVVVAQQEEVVVVVAPGGLIIIFGIRKQWYTRLQI
jgi:hypothetical protein